MVNEFSAASEIKQSKCCSSRTTASVGREGQQRGWLQSHARASTCQRNVLPPRCPAPSSRVHAWHYAIGITVQVHLLFNFQFASQWSSQHQTLGVCRPQYKQLQGPGASLLLNIAHFTPVPLTQVQPCPPTKNFMHTCKPKAPGTISELTLGVQGDSPWSCKQNNLADKVCMQWSRFWCEAYHLLLRYHSPDSYTENCSPRGYCYTTVYARKHRSDRSPPPILIRHSHSILMCTNHSIKPYLGLAPSGQQQCRQGMPQCIVTLPFFIRFLVQQIP